MVIRNCVVLATCCIGSMPAESAASVEKIRNEKVVVTEERLLPGEAEGGQNRLPSVVVYMSGGEVGEAGSAQKVRVKEGQTELLAAGAALKNLGSAELH